MFGSKKPRNWFEMDWQEQRDWKRQEQERQELEDQLARLTAAARAVMESIQNGYPQDGDPGLEKIASWAGSHVRILVSSEPLADLAALLLEAEGGSR